MMLSDVCLVCCVQYIQSVGGVCGRPSGWRVLADWARLGRPGSRLLLHASVAGLGRGILWTCGGLTHSLFVLIFSFLQSLKVI